MNHSSPNQNLNQSQYLKYENTNDNSYSTSSLNRQDFLSPISIQGI
jgi:hypothetical protein